jgi:hypothetical protein
MLLLDLTPFLNGALQSTACSKFFLALGNLSHCDLSFVEMESQQSGEGGGGLGDLGLSKQQGNTQKAERQTARQ